VERIDIERALDDLISNEEGMRFQSLGVALARQRWPELIACERHNDLGLDAYASPNSAANGVGRGLACSITATLGKLSGDAKTAKEHYGPFSILIFATPRKVTKETEKDWADRIRNEHGYELVVISRAEIIAALQAPDNAWMCRTHLRIPVPYQAPVTDTLRQIRAAAAEEASRWATYSRLGGKPRIRLSAVKLDQRGSETQEIFTTAHLRSWLAQGRCMVIEAPAGRGKTTTLIQLSQSEADSEGIPILLDLPGWIRSGLDILEYIARMPSFRARGIDSAALARSFRDEPYHFLLNGWNEVSSVHSEQATEMLRTVARDFLGAGIIVATRTHHIVPPLPDSIRLRLLPLTPDQRFHYLVEALGTAPACDLQSALIGDRVLDDLTRTPFILSAVAALAQSGRELPRTKLALLRALVALIEQSEEHAGHLQGQPLRSRADHYLRALATYLTSRGAVVLSETDARTVCNSVAERLRAAGQIASTPEPADILSALSSHHLLDRIDYLDISFRFEHQQFQEYYAALELRDVLARVVADANLAQTDVFVEQNINDPSWEEPLRMIAENLGTSADDVAAGKLLIEGALRVDPVFSAALAYLAGPSIGGQVRAGLSSRLRSLYATPNPQYRQLALAAMLATGADEFADILVPLLTNPDQQVRLAAYRAGREFHPSSLGADWQRIVSEWAEDHRMEFVFELTMHQRRAEVALAFVRTDPSEQVRLAALRALTWIGQYEQVTDILQSFPNPIFMRAIRQLHPDEIPPALHAHAISNYRALLEDTHDPRSRLQITLALAELGDSDTPARLKTELGALPAALVRELSDHALRSAVDMLRHTDPQWLSAWVTQRIIEGALWRDSWLSLVSEIATSLREQLLRRACTEDLRQSSGQGVIAVLKATATPESAKTLFMALRDHHRELLADPANQQKQTIDAQLRGLLRAIPSTGVIDGLSALLEQPPQSDELTIITDLFSAMGSTQEPDPRTSVPDHLRRKLRAYLNSAVPFVLAQEDFRGEAKGRLSSALGEVGDLDDIPCLVEMIRSDIARVREGRAARERGEQSARADGGPMCWSGWHVQALVRLAHAQSEAILLDLLNEPEYELDAAWGLAVIAHKDRPGPNAIAIARHSHTARDYRKVRSSPTEWSAGFDDELREKHAAAIRYRILSLIDASRSGDNETMPYHHRLKELARVLAALDPRNSAGLIVEIAGLPSRFDGWQRLALLEASVFAGIALPTDRAFAILDPVLEQFRIHGIYNDAHLLMRLLCLLSFVDVPARGIARMRDLLSEFRIAPHNQRDLLMALSQCGDEAGLGFLRDLARENDVLFQHSAREWLEAVAACPLPGAKAIVLSFVDPEVATGVGDRQVSEYAVDFLAGRIADLARAESSIANRILYLSAQPQSGQRRIILAKVIAWLDSSEALLAGLNLIDDASEHSIPYELWKAIEDLVLEKRPYKGTQSYTLAPRPAGEIRKRLFHMLRHDPTRARTAYTLLAQIEQWRLEYGRPASESRHPFLESAESWPPAQLSGPPTAGLPAA
jgi:hypothetical protein